MSITAIADLVCIVFLGILYARRFSEHNISKSNRLLNLCLIVMMATLLIDAAAYTLIGPEYPVPLRFLINIFSFEATCINVIFFTFYTEALFNENGKVNPWFFRIIKIVEIIWAVATAYEFISGHLITYGVNGVENINYTFPTYIVVLNLAIQLYLVVITIVNGKKIGRGMALLMSLFYIVPIVTSVLFSFLGIDFAYVFGAVMLGLVAEFIQRRQTQKVKQEQLTTQELATQQRYMKAFGDMVNAALWNIYINEANEVTGVKWSDEVRNMLGLTAEEYPDTLEAWLERLHPDDKDRVTEAFNHGLSTNDTENYVYDLEYRLRRKNGEYCWYHALGRMEYNDDDTRNLYGIIYDISAEKQLEMKQEELQTALNVANIESQRVKMINGIIDSSNWIYEIDSDDNIISAQYGDVIENKVDASSDENPMLWVELVHPEDRERTLEGFMAAITDHSGETSYDEIFRIIDRDGKYRWSRSVGEVMRRNDGSGEYFGMSMDMTRQMEEQQKRLLGAMPLSNDVLAKANIGMWAFELDEGQPPRMYDDETMLGLVGLDHQVTPEEAYHAWYDNIDEGSYDIVNDAVAKMMDGEHAEVQYPWHFPDGRTIIVRCGGVRNFDYTKGIRIEGTHQDVTQTLHYDEKIARQQQIEYEASKVRAEMLTFISDNEPDIDNFMNFFGTRVIEVMGCDQFIFRDMEGHRIVVNAEGFEDVPQRICEMCPFADFKADDYGDNGTIIMGDCAKGFDGIMTHPECPAKSTYLEKVYSDDKLAGLISVNYLNENHEFTENDIDIMKTVRAHLGLLIGRIREKQAEIARIEAESANKAKTEFLFNMSHDIRTPMNAILGYTDIGMRHVEDIERSKDSYIKIKSAGSHLLNLINDILEMSRIESGKIEMAENPVDVRVASRNINYMCEALAAPKDIDLKIEVGDLSNPYLYADELHISEIIINLVSNAVKYTPEGGQVTYSVNQISNVIDGKVTYRFEVTDNGIGMSEEFQRHLFEAFSREQTSTVSKIEGTGLGLSIVKKIVDMAGGTISVKSKQGEGSTFTVEIPFKVMDEAAIEKYREENILDEELAEDFAFDGKKVLLVEDNEMNREIATEILEEAGLIVETAEDGEIAVKTIVNKGIHYYDFILMDIQMPVMDGYEATKAIRALHNGNSIPIIALSANAFEEDRQKSVEAGMNGHVAKPINVRELFTVLAKFL